MPFAVRAYRDALQGVSQVFKLTNLLQAGSGRVRRCALSCVQFVGFLEELVEVEGAKGAQCRPAAEGIKTLTRALEQCFPGVIRMPRLAGDGLTHARQLVAHLRSAAIMTRAKQLGAEQCHAWLCTWLDPGVSPAAWLCCHRQ